MRVKELVEGMQFKVNNNLHIKEKYLTATSNKIVGET
jgi:hypothetical protein